MNTQDIKKFIVDTVLSQEGVMHSKLELWTAQEFSTVERNTILQAMSEAAQDGLVKRIDYTVPKSSWKVRSFYVPAGSQIIS